MTSPALLVAPAHPAAGVLRDLLAATDRPVVVCADADAALAVPDPGLIVLALDRDGDASAALCARLPWAQVPVVVLVTDPGPGDLLRVLASGAAACLSDALPPDTLAGHLAALAGWTADAPMRIDVTVALHADRRRRVQELHRWVSDADGGLASERVVNRLVESDRRASLGRLSGAVAHEFNNLLTIIAGRARLVRDRYWGDDATKAQLDELLTAADAATGLSRKLGGVGRPESMGPRTVVLASFLADVRDALAGAARPGTSVVLIPVPADARAWLDPARVEQVLISLGLNALDAVGTEGGQVTLAVQLPKDGGPLGFSVQDDGSGMTDAVLAKAFDPFFSTSGQSGLGLATVGQVVTALGGAVSVDTIPGQGTCITIALPTAEEDQPAAASEAPSSGGPIRVMVVEDEAGVRSLVATVLERAGFAVLACEGAEQALASAGKLDLLITDLSLEGMGGAELARRLQAVQPSLRVLFISGHTGAVVSDEGVDLEAPEFLQKPFTPDLLIARARRLLQQG